VLFAFFRQHFRKCCEHFSEVLPTFFVKIFRKCLKTS
jgi:hypothetical protein